MDNIFVERLWRSVKYEEVYLKAYQNVPEARAGIGAYLRFYNHERPHQALGYQTPQEIFEEGQEWRCLHEQGLALASNLETTSPVMVPTKPAEDSLNLALSLSKQWGPLQAEPAVAEVLDLMRARWCTPTKPDGARTGKTAMSGPTALSPDGANPGQTVYPVGRR